MGFAAGGLTGSAGGAATASAAAVASASAGAGGAVGAGPAGAPGAEDPLLAADAACEAIIAPIIAPGIIAPSPIPAPGAPGAIAGAGPAAVGEVAAVGAAAASAGAAEDAAIEAGAAAPAATAGAPPAATAPVAAAPDTGPAGGADAPDETGAPPPARAPPPAMPPSPPSIPGRVCMSCAKGAKAPADDEAPAWYPAIAATSWAHISSYMPSTAMIAGVSSPKTFCLMSETKAFRLAEIDCSGTVMERAASNADATSWDCRAAVSEWVAAAVSHAMYGAAACAIA
jgi:hypothetical protein